MTKRGTSESAQKHDVRMVEVNLRYVVYTC